MTTDQTWNAQDAGRELLGDVAAVIAGVRDKATLKGCIATSAEIARAVLASPALQDANRKMLDALQAEYQPKIEAKVAAEARRIADEITPGIRKGAAEDIAAAIETSVCEPGENCAERFCPDCTRYAQCQADAATARRIGGAS